MPTATDWKDLLQEILSRQGECSEEEYLRLTDYTSRFIEFTDGFVEILPMPADQHQAVLKFLFLAFFHFFEKTRGSVVHFAALRLRIRGNKFREPDIIVLLSATDKRRENRYWKGADLVVEVVSEDKPERDLVDKRSDYAEGKVPEYWIVNPQTETITVLTLKGDAYQEAGKYARGERAVSVLNNQFSLSVDEVFDAAQEVPA
jgi:Uma2 family endonuclease